jgi:hypothetical protein
MGNRMTALVILGDTSGSVTLQAPAAAGSSVHTLPAKTGTVMVSGNMPAFSAYLGGTQSISSGVTTKMQCSIEEFDTNTCYDTGLYRFTPNVAGYYQFNAQIDNLSGSPTRQFLVLYINGSAAKYGLDLGISTGNFGGAAGSVLSVMVYMNGSTDYAELYVNASGGFSLPSQSTTCYFQGYMVRTA